MHRQKTHRHGRWICVTFALLMLMTLASSIPARASGSLSDVGSEWYVAYSSHLGNRRIGVLAQSQDGRKVYCMESGAPSTLDFESVQVIADSEMSRSIAWLIRRYQDTKNPLIHAGIGILVHDAYDLNRQNWENAQPEIKVNNADAFVEAERLLQEARNHVPINATLRSQYEVGRRSGYVDVLVGGPDGVNVPDVEFTLNLSGPAVFSSDGKSTFRGTSGSDARRIYWTATGTGDVSVSVAYDYGTVEQLVSSQDYVRFATMKAAAGQTLSFPVRKEFAPLISTAVARRIVNEGDHVLDTVTSDVAAGDSWEEGVEVNALGYYFDSLEHADLGKTVHPHDNESASGYLERLRGLGHEPSGYASAMFDAPKRSVQVSAVSTANGNEPYLASADSGFGTWVWVIDHTKQKALTQEYVVKDVLSDFLEIPETLSIRKVPSVDSSVTEHSATVGSELSDVIVVTGLPGDAGSFKGNAEYGFQADDSVAEVKVFWSGSGDGSDDTPYKPAANESPEEDRHHRLVGAWRYAAANRTIKVGGGAPDMSGKPVNIIAETPGYYVFVYSFAGDARAAPVRSAYDDAWECVRVQGFVESRPESASIQTHAEPATVELGESSYDSATISGAVPEGSYITFSAFSTDSQNDTLNVEDPILDELRVDLTADVAEQTVRSDSVVAGHVGLLQWKATLWSSEGEILDSHELGLPEETTKIIAHANPGKSSKSTNETVDEARSSQADELARTGTTAIPALAIPASIALLSGMLMMSIPRAQRGKWRAGALNPRNQRNLAYPDER